jgi:hypothetical protein
MAVVSKIYYCCEWLWTERPYVWCQVMFLECMLMFARTIPFAARWQQARCQVITIQIHSPQFCLFFYPQDHNYSNFYTIWHFSTSIYIKVHPKITKFQFTTTPVYQHSCLPPVLFQHQYWWWTSRSQWPRSLRHPADGMDVCLLCLYVVLSCVGKGLCDGLITHPEESIYVYNCVWLRNLNTEGDKAQHGL